MSDMRMGRRGVVWKTPDVTADGLKLFACITMLIQATGVVIVENGMIHLEQYTQESLSEAMAADSHLMMLAGVSSVMQLVGGLALPIFAFLLVEGVKHTASFKRYLLAMAACALVSELPYDLAWRQKWVDFSSQNAMVAMVVCLLMAYFLELVQKKGGALLVLWQLAILLGALAWVTLLRAQYGLCLVLLTAVFSIFYARNGWKTLLGILVSLLYVTGPLAFYGIWCYNEVRKDRIPKYVYYAFYPLHLLVLGIIAKYIL